MVFAVEGIGQEPMDCGDFMRQIVCLAMFGMPDADLQRGIEIDAAARRPFLLAIIEFNADAATHHIGADKR